MLEWVAVDRLVEETVETEVETIDRVSDCFFSGCGSRAKCYLGSRAFHLLLTRGRSGGVCRMGCGRRKSA